MSKKKKIIAIILGSVIVIATVLMLIFWPAVSSFVSTTIGGGKASQGSSANSAGSSDGSSDNSSTVSPWFSSFIGSVQKLFGGGSSNDEKGSENSSSHNSEDAVTAEYKESVVETQTEITKLIEAGGESSIDQADRLADEEIRKAEATGNETYIVSAYLAKAALLIDTDRAQEALDSILIPFEKKYANNEEYIYDIWGYESLAYRALDNQDKADEYFSKLPEQGWDE